MSIESAKHHENKRDRFKRVLALSAILHAPAVIINAELSDDVSDTIYVVKENVRRTINSAFNTDEKKAYIDSIQESGRNPRLRDFYLDTEELEGAIDEETKKKSKEELNAQIEHFKKMAESEDDRLKVLQAITDYAHKAESYEDKHTYMSTFLLEGKGNCALRQKMTAAITEEVYPDSQIRSQKIKYDGLPHTRTLVQVNGKWHPMEGNTHQALTDDDLKGTVLFEKDADIAKYLGRPVKGTFIAPDEEIESETKFSITDSLLGKDMPVDWDNVRNIDTKSTKREPEPEPEPEKPMELIIDWDKYVKPKQDDMAAEMLNYLRQPGQLGNELIDVTDKEWAFLRSEQLIEITKLTWQKALATRPVSINGVVNYVFPYDNFTVWIRFNRGRHEDIMKLAENIIQVDNSVSLSKMLEDIDLNCAGYSRLEKKLWQTSKDKRWRDIDFIDERLGKAGCQKIDFFDPDVLSAEIVEQIRQGKLHKARRLLSDHCGLPRSDQLIKIIKLFWQKYPQKEDILSSPYYHFDRWSRCSKDKHADIIKLAENMIQENQIFWLIRVLEAANLNCDEYFRFKKMLESNPSYQSDLEWLQEYHSSSSFWKMEEQCQKNPSKK